MCCMCQDALQKENQTTMNNFGTRVSQLARPTQSAWYHKRQEEKGKHTPPGGNHYFQFGKDVSLCKAATKDKTWQINGSWSYNDNYHPSVCKDCLEIYTSMRNRTTEGLLKSRITPHHIHFQNCSKCGMKCIYLSNNKNHVKSDRIHIGCNGNEVSLVQ